MSAIEQYYQEICKQNRIRLKVVEEDFAGDFIGGGPGRVFTKTYYFQKEYKDLKIEFKQVFGSTNLSDGMCNLPNKPGIYAFSVNTKSLFSSWFSKDKNRLQVLCKNEVFAKRIQELLVESGIEDLMKDFSLEPIIELSFEDNNWQLNTRHSLQFTNKEKIFFPFYRFYVLLIDELY